MIAADTSSLSALLIGEQGRDIDRLAEALSRGDLRLPPVVVTELLSDRGIGALVATKLVEVETLEITAGYWHRAGKTRAKLKDRKLKANVADALITQSCLDHDVALITRDTDFQHFAEHCGLKLA